MQDKIIDLEIKVQDLEREIETANQRIKALEGGNEELYRLVQALESEVWKPRKKS